MDRGIDAGGHADRERDQRSRQDQLQRARQPQPDLLDDGIVVDQRRAEIAARQPAYSDREKAYTVTQNVLQSTPDIAGVFAGNDEEALGALRALKQSGKEVPIIGVDANADNLKAILAGDLYGSIAQGNYDMGRLGVEKALEVIAGKTIDKRIDSGATLITKENAQELLDFRASIK